MRRGREIIGDREDFVDNVYDTAAEIEVLCPSIRLAVNW